jgi:SH3-like domain-containing protein
VRQHLPVQVLATFAQWRKIRLYDGEEGWVHANMLSMRPYALVLGDVLRPLYAAPTTSASMIAQIEPQVVVELVGCAVHWCKVRTQTYEGYMATQILWGNTTPTH